MGRRILEHEPDPGGDLDRPERERIVPVELERAFDGGRDLDRDQPRDRQRERALTGTGRADDQQDRTGLDLEVDGRDGGAVGPGIGDREVPGLERDGCQSGNPSRTPARFKARWSATEPPATMTAAEMPMAIPRMTWISGSTVL